MVAVTASTPEPGVTVNATPPTVPLAPGTTTEVQPARLLPYSNVVTTSPSDRSERLKLTTMSVPDLAAAGAMVRPEWRG